MYDRRRSSFRNERTSLTRGYIGSSVPVAESPAPLRASPPYGRLESLTDPTGKGRIPTLQGTRGSTSAPPTLARKELFGPLPRPNSPAVDRLDERSRCNGSNLSHRSSPDFLPYEDVYGYLLSTHIQARCSLLQPDGGCSFRVIKFNWVTALG